MSITLPAFRRRDIVVEANSGPSEIQCQECKLLMLPMECVNFVEFIGADGQARVSGGTESWKCFKCWREIVVRWNRTPKEAT